MAGFPGFGKGMGAARTRQRPQRAANAPKTHPIKELRTLPPSPPTCRRAFPAGARR